MAHINTLSCPVCKQIISYDIYGLLSGQTFTCPGCSLVLSLAEESHDTLQDAMKKYEELKKESEKR